MQYLWGESINRYCSNLPLHPFCIADKTETPVPGSDIGVLGGRGWIARAALLKTAHWAVFALSSATAPQLFESTLAVLYRSSNKTETPASSQRWSSWWARVDSNNHGFVPPKPFDSKKLGIMRIFGHQTWNTRTFRPGRNVKSGLQSGLFLGVRGVLSQHSGDGLRSGNITTCDIMCVPAEGIHAAAVADHSAQLSG